MGLWVRDAKARVLGPLEQAVILDLINNGRLRGVVDVSTDGATWAPVDCFPEIAGAQAAQGGPERAERDRAEAARLRAQLEKMKDRPPHQVFGLTPDATIGDYRAAFFALVKCFYPGTLPPEAHSELKQASLDTFNFLSRLMNYIEKLPPTPAKLVRQPPILGKVPTSPQLNPADRMGAPQPTGRLTPVPIAGTGPGLTPPYLQRMGNGSPLGRPTLTPAPTPTPVAGAPAPLPRPTTASLRQAAAQPPPRTPTQPPPVYKIEDFVGIERPTDSKVVAKLKVTDDNCHVFTSHPLVNFANGGAFVPCEDPVTLGASVELVLNVGDPPKEIAAKGTVVAWSAGNDKQRRGFAVKLRTLSQSDQLFLADFAKKNQQASRGR